MHVYAHTQSSMRHLLKQITIGFGSFDDQKDLRKRNIFNTLHTK